MAMMINPSVSTVLRRFKSAVAVGLLSPRLLAIGVVIAVIRRQAMTVKKIPFHIVKLIIAR